LSRERQQQVLELLDEALELPAGDRPAFLDAACGEDRSLRQEVEMLLATRQEGGFLETPAFDVHGEDPDVGRSIGPYRLVRLLGRGGMGAVYLAEREDFEHRVALKLMRRGLDLDAVAVGRFHNERQILARLDHPCVARLLDGGTTAGRRPYLVMEHVDGEPLDRYCARRGLSLRARLELFAKVCSAVQFAHQNLVVHRDLKPGNVLVTADGQPKLLDFGVAKLLDEGLAARSVATADGRGPMTLRYASPEQVRFEPVTTASDVYSLGVVLYELLTGRDPYQVESGREEELARAIREREPPRPSTAARQGAAAASSAGIPRPGELRHRLAGDLDAIVLRALAKEPRDRYGSVDQLAEDVRRHLAGLPVAARTGTFVYRAGKFVRRHRLPLAVTAAFLLVSLGFGAVSTVLWRRAVEERRRALKASEFLEDLVLAADPDAAAGADLTAVELLRTGLERIRTDLADWPELRIEMAGTLGRVFRQLGARDETRRSLELALEAAREHYGGDHPEVATALNNAGAWLIDSGNYSGAESRFREALAMQGRLGREISERFRMMNNLATSLTHQGAPGKLDEAESLYREVLEKRKERYGPDDPDVASSLRHLGMLHYLRGDAEAAEPFLREALRIRRHVFGTEDTRVASACDLLGRVREALGDAAEAESLYDEALAIRRRRLGEDHVAVAQTRTNLARLLLPQAPETARVLLEQALATYGRFPAAPWEAAEAESVLGAYLAGRGRYAEAQPCLIESYRVLREARGECVVYAADALRRIIELDEVRGLAEQAAQRRRSLDECRLRDFRTSKGG
jgi:serine/threonine-protein kinase